MEGFDSVECANCGDPFGAHPSAKAAESGYCSPACHGAGEGLT